MAQLEWLDKHRASPPSVCSRRVGLFALVALVALVFAWFLYTLLNGLFQGYNQSDLQLSTQSDDRLATARQPQPLVCYETPKMN